MGPAGKEGGKHMTSLAGESSHWQGKNRCARGHVEGITHRCPSNHREESVDRCRGSFFELV